MKRNRKNQTKKRALKLSNKPIKIKQFKIAEINHKNLQFHHQEPCQKILHQIHRVLRTHRALLLPRMKRGPQFKAVYIHLENQHTKNHQKKAMKSQISLKNSKIALIINFLAQKSKEKKIKKLLKIIQKKFPSQILHLQIQVTQILQICQ